MSRAITLARVRARLASGELQVPPSATGSVMQTVDAVIDLLDAAAMALDGASDRAADVVAHSLAQAREAVGRAWAGHLYDLGVEFRVQTEIRDAVAQDTKALEAALGGLLAGTSHTALLAPPRLTCAACGGVAVTFTIDADVVSFDRLSPVYPRGERRGQAAEPLRRALRSGDVHRVLDELAARPDGVDAYCPPCRRVYCARHYGVDARWSGSWHTDTTARCPLGHAREID